MISSTTEKHYTRTAQAIHWIMAIIFIFVWLIGFYSGNFLTYEGDFNSKIFFILLHKNIATVIIFFVAFRIFWRYTHPAPALPESMSSTMKIMAHVGHLFLYIILLALPISGCLFSWTYGQPAPVLYLFNLPQLVNANPELFPLMQSIHIYLSWFAGVLVAGHILVALKHHFIDKDHVLQSMTKQAK